MKKVYIPSEEELLKMQDLTKVNGIYHNGSIMYKYLLCKVVEALVIEGKLEDRGILEKTYKYFRENPQIAIAICKMYPEEIKFSEYAQNDIRLCEDLLTGALLPDKTIYSLDNLTHFQNGVGVYTNYYIMRSTIETLYEKLTTTPQYRFEYQEPNSLLDSIFSCNLSSYEFNSQTAEQLVKIEPAHALKLDKNVFNKYNIQRMLTSSLTTVLESYINAYCARYGMERIVFPEYYREDIIKNPDDNVKRLLRYLDRHKRTYQ
ncbi:MAG: hypothetical protein IJE89_03025 [Bacilli bacterium]|nr:hypothetical protein [Bacilli bacterium]